MNLLYSLLWTIFRPGDVIYAPKHESLYLLKPTATGMTGFELEIEFLSWNGDTSGYDQSMSSIAPIEGTVNIRDLDLYPLEYAADPEVIKLACKLRGQRFVDLRGIHTRVLKRSGNGEVDLLGPGKIQPPVREILTRRHLILSG
jgi:hypothetical protein